MLALLALLVSCANPHGKASVASLREISSSQVKGLLAYEDVRMLDVRSDNERLVGTVPGAVEVLFGPRQWTERLVSPEDVDRFLGEIRKLFANKRTRIIVFCNVGVRARAAGARLVTNGYTNVMIVRDGFLGNQFGEGLEAAAFE